MIPLKDNIPSYRKPIINYLIILANTVVFVYHYFFLQSRLEIEAFIHKYGFTPIQFLTNFPRDIHTLFTSMFLHGGMMHFLGNMWFLYIFGDNVEDRYGHLKYFLVYVISGVSAVFLQFVINPLSRIPMIGASGAISGVLGSYFVFYPSAGVVTLIPFGLFSRIVILPAVIFLGLWFIFQFLSGTQSLAIQAVLGKEVGGVAYFAHIGGFLCGLIIAILSRRKRRLKTYWRYL